MDLKQEEEMGKKRKRHSVAFKIKVVLTALKGEKTIAQIASQYEIHPAQIVTWKKQILERLPEVFERKTKKSKYEEGKEKEELYKKIGQLQVEVDWLKKKSEMLT
jgi:transposase-like protein